MCSGVHLLSLSFALTSAPFSIRSITVLLADFGKNCTKFIKFVAKTAKDYNAELFILVIIDLAQTKEMIYDNIINDHKAKRLLVLTAWKTLLKN